MNFLVMWVKAEEFSSREVPVICNPARFRIRKEGPNSNAYEIKVIYDISLSEPWLTISRFSNRLEIKKFNNQKEAILWGELNYGPNNVGRKLKKGETINNILQEWIKNGNMRRK